MNGPTKSIYKESFFYGSIGQDLETVLIMNGYFMGQ
jgi:hypothetical protein